MPAVAGSADDFVWNLKVKVRIVFKEQRNLKRWLKLLAVQDRALFSVFPLLKTANLLQIHWANFLSLFSSTHTSNSIGFDVVCAIYFAKFPKVFIAKCGGGLEQILRQP